eukprot:14633742-Alexandrium_andersonii.AAC.2
MPEPRDFGLGRGVDFSGLGAGNSVLRRDPERQIRWHMDTTGWVLAQDVLDTNILNREGPLSDEDLRVLAEMENSPEITFLMARKEGKLYLRAAQAHSGGVGAQTDVSKAFEVLHPGHEDWRSAGLHGTSVD